ncbi:MAG: hypothetical protein Kow0059_07100 [Candidatus Sumerlaeia bacterium]
MPHGRADGAGCKRKRRRSLGDGISSACGLSAVQTGTVLAISIETGADCSETVPAQFSFIGTTTAFDFAQDVNNPPYASGGATPTGGDTGRQPVALDPARFIQPSALIGCVIGSTR